MRFPEPARPSQQQIEPKGASGGVSGPDAYYPIAPPTRTANDAFDEQEATAATQTVGGLATGTTKVLHARRTAFIQGISINQGNGACELVRRVDCGQGMPSCNERWELAVGLPGNWVHNPTMGGTQILPTTAPQARIQFSPTVHYDVRQTGAQIICEGCTIPFDFQASGFWIGNAASDHGGNELTSCLWHRCRQFHRTTFNFRPGIHRVQQWCYSPRGWNNENAGPVVLYDSSLMFLQDKFRGIASPPVFYDPVTNASQAAGTGAEWDANDSLTYSIDGTNQQLQVGGGVTATRTYPFSTDYCGGWVQGIDPVTSDGLGLAWYWKGFRGAGSDQGLRRINQMTVQQVRNPLHPAAGRDVNSGQAITFESKSVLGRVPGWVPMQWFFSFVFTEGGMQSIIREMHTQRLVDLENDFCVPRSVIEPMLAQGYPYANAPILGSHG